VIDGCCWLGLVEVISEVVASATRLAGDSGLSVSNEEIGVKINSGTVGVGVGVGVDGVAGIAAKDEMVEAFGSTTLVVVVDVVGDVDVVVVGSTVEVVERVVAVGSMVVEVEVVVVWMVEVVALVDVVTSNLGVVVLVLVGPVVVA
jgi:hypothetical protein